MRNPIGILVVAALGLGFVACGGSSGSSSSQGTSAARDEASVTAYFPNDKNDRDNDNDHNDDDEGVLGYGHAADASDQQASVALVTSYFAAAAAENGSAACSLLAPFIAESVVENYGHTADLSGKTCATVMSKLFKLHHALFLTKHETLRIPAVRVEGDKALAILEFPTIPEVREIAERRVGTTWRVLDLSDGILE